MKKLFHILVLVLSLTSCECEKEYRGPIVDMFIVGPADRVDSKNMIVFYSDSLKRNIAVNVTMSTYVNHKVGDEICFSLTKYEIGK